MIASVPNRSRTSSRAASRALPWGFEREAELDFVGVLELRDRYSDER